MIRNDEVFWQRKTMKNCIGHRIKSANVYWTVDILDSWPEWCYLHTAPTRQHCTDFLRSIKSAYGCITDTFQGYNRDTNCSYSETTGNGRCQNTRSNGVTWHIYTNPGRLSARRFRPLCRLYIHQSEPTTDVPSSTPTYHTDRRITIRLLQIVRCRI